MNLNVRSFRRGTVLLALAVTLAACSNHVAAPVVAADVPAVAAATATRVAPSPAVAAVSAADLVDHAGDAIESAIAVPADAPHDGADFENNWIYDRYGRFRRISSGLGHASDRRYDVVTVELPDHSHHTVYFDITEVFNAWQPPAKQ